MIVLIFMVITKFRYYNIRKTSFILLYSLSLVFTPMDDFTRKAFNATLYHGRKYFLAQKHFIHLVAFAHD